MSLPTFWFCVIAFLWVGYLFLDGLRLRCRHAVAGPRSRRHRVGACC